MKEALKLALEALEKKAGSWGVGQEALNKAAITAIKEALAPTSTQCEVQPEQEPVFKWRSVFQEMPTENSHLLFCFGVHVVEGSYTRNYGWASLAYGEAQPDFWAYMPPPPHHKRNQELYAMPPKRPWVGLTDAEMWELWNSQGDDAMEQQAAIAFARAIEAELKEKNT